ncbi:serine/arginine repetitive matrix protein 3 isoform X4 [Hippocampus comes]|uniref:serine/arginine repetitive matrix protein 3 isoform X4 n=1 Tax=Hippocampus comes TaxID=109280 RepID=UPI00094F0F89|nr:PREDICTED: serine/arginine repetitive matrix protein 3-like isoform X4 [Hippocampus comes]XP_019750747.1 PREDICTED: serine/arginine repetitive matrix protein 3-like isoform X4 [Hippocampus comes]
MYDAARVPTPNDGANGLTKPAAPAAGPDMGATTEGGGLTPPTTLQAKPEEGQPGAEEEEPQPVLVKKPRREILDHDRKRRVELKCMELQEMMEEQGYTEEEIQQKVSTFRQMLMDKEGVITRDGSQPVVNHMHYYPEDDGELPADEDGDYADDYHSDNRGKRKSSSSPSPRPKKRKKKKSGRRRSRFGSSSPNRKQKKKKSGKKHKHARSASGSTKKRRYRSSSPKDKHKDKNKQKKRSPAETPGRSVQRQGSCCSSRSASLSSAGSASKSPSRLNSKHKRGGKKAASASLSPGPDSPTACHNGDHPKRSHNCHKAGRLNHTDGDKVQDKPRIPAPGSKIIQSTLLKEQKLYSAPSRNQAVPTCTAGEAGSVDSGNTSGRRASQRGRNKGCHSPAHSSDSARSHNNHAHRGRSSRHQRKTKSSHSSKRHHRSGRGQAHNRSPSASSGRHSHTSSRKKEVSRSKQNRHRSSSWSSERSSCAHRDRGLSTTKSPHNRQNASRDRDSPNRCDSDTDSRARRRSRSYSPIRKRRRDSPSFMEARRITRDQK